jgi:hypothetical protein
MRRWLVSLLLFVGVTAVLAQTAAIKIEHISTGETPRDIWITVRNVGDVPLTSLEIYVDGVKRDEMDMYMEPGDGFKTYLRIDEGTHLIEVRTAEGAYDSLNLTVAAPAPEEVEVPPEEIPPEELVPPEEEVPPEEIPTEGPAVPGIDMKVIAIGLSALVIGILGVIGWKRYKEATRGWKEVP